MQEQPAKVEVRWDWIGEGWQMFAEQWGTWVLHTLIIGIIGLIILVPFYILIFIVAFQNAQQGNQDPPLAIFLIYPVLFGIMFLVGPFFAAGSYHTALKQLRGESISVGDLFGGMQYYPRLFVLTLISGLASLVACAFFFIPSLILAGLWLFAAPLVIERGLGPIDALKESSRVTKTNLLMFILFAFVVMLLAYAGSWACYIGLLVTYPLWFTTIMVAYRDCFGVQGARRFGPQAPPPPPNYNPTYNPSYSTAPPNYPPPPPPPAPPQTPQAPPPPSGPAVGTVQCPHCQAIVSANASFCQRCGQLLHS